MSIGITTAGIAAALPGIATGVGMLGGAKVQSGAARESAALQTAAANRAAELQRQTASDQLAYVRGESQLDRMSKRHADRQNYGLSKAEGLNDFRRYGDASFNTRASELSRGRSDDKRYGATQNQVNVMRRLMNMPNKELVSYVEPDALQLTAPELPDYVEDPTPMTWPKTTRRV